MAKHQRTEFVIGEDKTTILKENVEGVRTLFGVEITFSPKNPHDRMQWICLEGSTDELREKAKTYITSLCCTKLKRCVDCEIPPSVFEDLKHGGGGQEIEMLSGAVLSFSDAKAYLQGDDLAFAVALSEIERRITAFRKQTESNASAKYTGTYYVEHDAENIPQHETDGTTDIPPYIREFARKLDFQDKDIDAVVRTFGTEINSNKLLDELVKYSASTLRLSSSPEDTIVPPVARGAQYPRGTRTLQSGSVRKPEICEVADQHVKPLQADHLRPIVIDGSNVAMHHGNQQIFSCRGIQLCVEYFLRRGHNDITVFVPMWRREEPRPESPISEPEILEELARKNILKFTPSRWSGNRHIVCYDDNFIVALADRNEGIIVSNDNFRDLQRDNPRWKETIEQRTLGYTFVADFFMPPDDPLGRRGPSLDDFLRKGSATHPKICPYLKNCTFGNRCKYYHPERDTQRQREKSPTRNSPETSEAPPTCSVEARLKPTTTNQSTRNSVGDPRVSLQPQVMQSHLESACTVSNTSITSGNENSQNYRVRDPRVSISTFQSNFENRGRSREFAVRGRRQAEATGSLYDHTRDHFRSGEQYFPAYHGGNVYSDYPHPMASDYRARNPQYQGSVYCPPGLTQFPPLPPAQWLPYSAQHQFPQAAGTGYPTGAGQFTYIRTYFEPAEVPYGNLQGQRPRDQVDSGTESQENCISKEKFDALVGKFEEVFELNKETVIRFLRNHPKECADEDVNKLAELYVVNKE